jgi:hypothetical protein
LKKDDHRETYFLVDLNKICELPLTITTTAIDTFIVALQESLAELSKVV